MLYRAVVPLVLASASPRRRRLLASLGLEFEVAPARVPEEEIPGESPEEHVRRLAAAKRAAVAADRPRACVLAADTVVAVDGEILGKPDGEEGARRMLARLSGRDHLVFSGFALARGHETVSGVAVTRVFFRELSPELIDAYVKSGEPLDKAGGYGIQGMGAALVAEVRGSYTNVVGLPLAQVMAALTDVGAVTVGRP